MDSNLNNVISLEEFKTFLGDFNLSLKDKEIMDIFLDIDDDRNNILTLQEFQR